MNSATLSDCGAYRYSLYRVIDDCPSCVAYGQNLMWVMLNPSTADASKDDPTIRKVVGFTRRAGYGGVWVVNLFAFRATKPKVLRDAIRNHGLLFAEGPENRVAIAEGARRSVAIVCAWGAEPLAQERGHAVLSFLRSLGKPLLCLGTTQHGAPLHPLMPSYDGHPLVAFSAEQAPSATEGTK